MEKEFTIIAIHGEGDQDTVNALQAHRNKMDGINTVADKSPDIIIVLRDEAHEFRIEWPVKTWDEVEQWKGIAGYDADKRHWKHGAKVKVTIG